jgi:geranylgeranyl pyrophosphate synthase
MAILAGDAMVALAFEVIAADAEPAVAAALVTELAVATGPCGMIGGQVLDMESENTALSLDDLQALHRMKTGALLKASCRLGALAAGAEAPILAALSDFGIHLGLAFQIVDDLLDETASPQQMGKATGKDRQKGKNTYPSLLGIPGSRQAAQEQLAAALASIRPLGPRAHGLALLARFVVERQL